MVSPIFIISMPRSGSTLLQRILLSHKSIGGTAEPWLMLPLVYMLKDNGVISEYSSRLSSKAINDMLDEAEDGGQFINEKIREFANGIYGKILKDDEVYFLDKTPRYYLIIDELYQIFPKAKFIFLFRNPTHIYASILKTWCDNKFSKLYGNHNDLNFGFSKISSAFLKYKGQDNTYALNYEALVSQPEVKLKELQEFLNIDRDEDLTKKFVNSEIDTKNKLGDPTGIKMYNTISPDTLQKWKNIFNTRYRKRVLKNYINNTLSDKDLEAQGYNKNAIIEEINGLNNKGKFNFFRDVFNFIFYKVIIRFNLYNYVSKDMRWSKDKFMS